MHIPSYPSQRSLRSPPTSLITPRPRSPCGAARTAGLAQAELSEVGSPRVAFGRGSRPSELLGRSRVCGVELLVGAPGREGGEKVWKKPNASPGILRHPGSQCFLSGRAGWFLACLGCFWLGPCAPLSSMRKETTVDP